MKANILAATAFVASAAFFCTASHAQTIYDSGGFEAPRFDPAYINLNDPTVIGNLRGQDAAVSIWRESTDDPSGADGASTGTAVVETLHPDGGLQDVAVTRTQYDIEFAPQFNVTPTGLNNLVNISWSEEVPAFTTTNGDTPSAYGPFFGIDAYDSSGATPLRIGGFGIDYTTDELLFEDSTIGGFNITSNDLKVNPDEYYNLEMSLNYATSTYNCYLNGTEVVANAPFFSNGITEFTDADIAALQDDGSAFNNAGTAYFDNYSIELVPEPATIGLFSLALISGLACRRGKSR